LAPHGTEPCYWAWLHLVRSRAKDYFVKSFQNQIILWDLSRFRIILSKTTDIAMQTRRHGRQLTVVVTLSQQHLWQLSRADAPRNRIHALPFGGKDKTAGLKFRHLRFHFSSSMDLVLYFYLKAKGVAFACGGISVGWETFTTSDVLSDRCDRRSCY
jgi:hypothetical protein